MTDKTGKPLNPPPWESFSRDVHPAFKPLDKAEMEKLALAAIAEAQQFVGGPANALASPEQRFLEGAERRRVHHEANILVTTGQIQEDHIRYWTEAMIDLGRFDAARYYDAKAEVVAEACARPDAEDCGCPREKVKLALGAKEVEGELDRRFALKFQFDPYRGKVVTLYQCSKCGMLNAMAEPPERQRDREAAQRQIEAHTRAAIARGEKPTIQASDAHFLKGAT